MIRLFLHTLLPRSELYDLHDLAVHISRGICTTHKWQITVHTIARLVPVRAFLNVSFTISLQLRARFGSLGTTWK